VTVAGEDPHGIAGDESGSAQAAGEADGLVYSAA